jgi:CheY-like chemotaxis protein
MSPAKRGREKVGFIMTGRAMRILVCCANPALVATIEAVLGGDHVSLTFVDNPDCMMRLAAYDMHDLLMVEPTSAMDGVIKALREDAFTYGRQRPAVLALQETGKERPVSARLYDVALTHPFVPQALLSAVCETIDHVVLIEAGLDGPASLSAH